MGEKGARRDRKIQDGCQRGCILNWGEGACLDLKDSAIREHDG